jgi:hypothetical protein
MTVGTPLHMTGTTNLIKVIQVQGHRNMAIDVFA